MTDTEASRIAAGLTKAQADTAELRQYRLDALARLMSDISEDCWCAGWISGNEFALYRMAFLGIDRRYGMSEVREADIVELRRLALATDTWVVWGVDGEEFVQLTEFSKHPAILTQEEASP